MHMDLQRWQRRLVEVNSMLHRVLEEGPRRWGNLPPLDWYWTWEQIMTTYELARALYAKGAEEQRNRIKPENEEEVAHAEGMGQS